MLEADMSVVFNKVHVKWNCVIFFFTSSFYYYFIQRIRKNASWLSTRKCSVFKTITRKSTAETQIIDCPLWRNFPESLLAGPSCRDPHDGIWFVRKLQKNYTNNSDFKWLTHRCAPASGPSCINLVTNRKAPWNLIIWTQNIADYT